MCHHQTGQNMESWLFCSTLEHATKTIRHCPVPTSCREKGLGCIYMYRCTICSVCGACSGLIQSRRSRYLWYKITYYYAHSFPVEERGAEGPNQVEKKQRKVFKMLLASLHISSVSFSCVRMCHLVQQ